MSWVEWVATWTMVGDHCKRIAIWVDADWHGLSLLSIVAMIDAPDGAAVSDSTLSLSQYSRHLHHFHLSLAHPNSGSLIELNWLIRPCRELLSSRLAARVAVVAKAVSPALAYAPPPHAATGTGPRRAFWWLISFVLYCWILSLWSAARDNLADDKTIQTTPHALYVVFDRVFVFNV